MGSVSAGMTRTVNCDHNRHQKSLKVKNNPAGNKTSGESIRAQKGSPASVPIHIHGIMERIWEGRCAARQKRKKVDTNDMASTVSTLVRAIVYIIPLALRLAAAKRELECFTQRRKRA